VKERSATAFWRSIYAKGNCLLSYSTDTNFIYGVRAFELINSCSRIKPLPLKYTLASQTLKTKGISMKVSTVKCV
jgi:hypothetical protein